MKKIFLITFIISSTYVFAGRELFNLQSNTPESIQRINLIDGRVITPSKDVDTIYFPNSSLEYIELNSGEIIDRLDIESIEINLPNGEFRVLATGVDGGGS